MIIPSILVNSALNFFLIIGAIILKDFAKLSIGIIVFLTYIITAINLVLFGEFDFSIKRSNRYRSLALKIKVFMKFGMQIICIIRNMIELFLNFLFKLYILK